MAIDKIRKLLKVNANNNIPSNYKANPSKCNEFCDIIKEHIEEICSKYKYTLESIDPCYCGCTAIITNNDGRYIYLYLNYYEKLDSESLRLFTGSGVIVRRVKMEKAYDKYNNLITIITPITNKYVDSQYCNIYEIEFYIHELMNKNIRRPSWMDPVMGI